MMDTKEVLLQWFINFFDKKSALLADKSASASGIKNEYMSNKELAEDLHKPIIRKLKKERYTHLLKIIFGVLNWLICNCQANLIKEFVFYYVLLIFVVNMHGLFP